MSAAPEVALLTEFRDLLDHYEFLASDNYYDVDKKREVDQLEARIGESLEHVRELVERAVSVENIEDRWNGGGWMNPFDALLRIPQVTRDIKHLLSRAVGVYQRGGPKHAAAPVSLPPFSFVTDVPLRTVLERNAGELGLAMTSRAWTSAIVLAGSIAEGVLYFLLSQRSADATTAASAITTRNPKKKIQGPIETWKLWAYIDVADEMKCLQGTTSAIAHGVLRDFRNMVHPWVQIKDGLEPTENVAAASVVYLRAVIGDVMTALRPSP